MKREDKNLEEYSESKNMEEKDKEELRDKRSKKTRDVREKDNREPNHRISFSLSLSLSHLENSL